MVNVRSFHRGGACSLLRAGSVRVIKVSSAVQTLLARCAKNQGKVIDSGSS
jgi:hypothetical protein